MKNLFLSYFLFYSIIVSSETILCELKGTFEETSEQLSKKSKDLFEELFGDK